jgi:regulation of enolase protein 1 (concanavalin A-like superfamily)
MDRYSALAVKNSATRSESAMIRRICQNAAVFNIQNTIRPVVAGVMVRESLDAALRVSPAGALSNISAPCWIKLTRKGNVFSAFLSKDGKVWGKAVAVDTIPMASNVFVGLALTSHDETTTTLATFDRVTVGPITK